MASEWRLMETNTGVEVKSPLLTKSIRSSRGIEPEMLYTPHKSASRREESIRYETFGSH